MQIVLSILWMLLVSISISIGITPLVGYVIWIIESPSLASYPLLVLGIPLCLAGGVLLLAGFAFAWSRILPKPPNGRFKLLQDRGSILWAINNAVPTLYMKWFQSTLFLNDHVRYLLLKSFNCDVKQTTWITSNAHITDLRYLHFGHNVMVGEHAVIAASIQPTPRSLVLGEVFIGDNTLIGTLAVISSFTIIGKNSIIQTSTKISPYFTGGDNIVIGAGSNIGTNVVVGNNTKIGADSIIGVSCKIGNKVIIGKHCTVTGGCTIPDNTRIPSGSVITKESLALLPDS